MASKPRNWETLDQNEQWEAAVEQAKREVDADRSRWEAGTRLAAMADAELKFNTVRERWTKALVIVATFAAILVAGALLAFWAWTAWLGNQADAARDAETRSWADTCITGGGMVVRDAADGGSGQLRLCVAGGKVASTHA